MIKRDANDRYFIQPPMMVESNDQTATTQVLSFMLGKQLYGLEVAYIYEVSRMVAITEIPDSPPDVLGVIDYRGTVVPVIDLEARFGLETHTPSLVTPIIIAWTGKYAVGLIAREICEVLSINPYDIMEPEEFGQPRRHVAGVAKIDDGLLLIMNPAGLLSERLMSRLEGADV
ncbi:MAG: purine-binding chemotaxis protein CheW [Anaerolineae bacterium]|nr:purine-binding chemotaxis protein CheW [Anaerolineae bacterium]